MKRTAVLQEIRKMRFEEAYYGWQKGRLSQSEAARMLGVCERSFRRYRDRYEEQGMEGLMDKRISQDSHRRAPVDEVMALEEKYKNGYTGWNVKHFYTWYRREGGNRSYTWVKNKLQEARLAIKAKRKGAHRKRRERAAVPGMLLHQDGSSHEWVAGQKWDLIVTMDDATNEHYSMFFVQEESTGSSFAAVEETIAKKGLFCSLYTDRGSHYWHTPEAGGRVDKENLTQFGRAMKQLGISMIAAYSPEARGRSERMFRTHQDRLCKELAKRGIKKMDAANRYLTKTYMPNFNAEFACKSREPGTAFVTYIGTELKDILCEQYERTVGNDNCVHFQKRILQIPSDQYRFNYVKTRVRVHRYCDGMLGVFHGPRKLAHYDARGLLITNVKKKVSVQIHSTDTKKSHF
jgi:transposase